MNRSVFTKSILIVTSTFILAFPKLGFSSFAYRIKVEGTINPGSADYIKSAIEKTNMDTEAQGLIIQLNTPGGLLSSTREIVQSMSQSSKPIVVFIAPGGGSATSAGALITLAAHVAIMLEGTNIGAAHPVGPSGQAPEGPMNDKAVQDTAAMARSQAELRGRNRELAEKIVTKSLSFTADEAFKNKIIDMVIPSESDLIQALKKYKKGKESIFPEDLNTVVDIPMSLKQSFLHQISDPSISTLLISLAGIALYTEISSGFTLIVPGILGLFLLILGFVSLQMLPINTGGVALLILGLGLLIAEFFVTSFGLLALTGLGALFLGSLFLVDSAQLQLGISPNLIGSFFLAVASVIALFGFIAWRDSRKRIRFGLEGMIGQLATVTSVNGPDQGTIVINGELWNFKSIHPVQVGDQVVIQSFQGSFLEVNPVKTCIKI